MRSLRPAFLALSLVLSVVSSPMATSLALAICCSTADEVCPQRGGCCAEEPASGGALACAGEPMRGDAPMRSDSPFCPVSASECPLLRNVPAEPARTRVPEGPALDAHALAVLVPLAGADGAAPDALSAIAATLVHAVARAPSTPPYLSLRHLLL
jgi:hypothetical protein